MATEVDLTKKLNQEFIIMFIFNLFNIIFNSAVIPFVYQHTQQPFVFVEDRVVLTHSCFEVEVKRTRDKLFETYLKLFGTLLKNLHSIYKNIDTSLALPYTTSCSFFPLIQQDVAVGASIEVPFGPVSGSGVAYPWVGFAFHAGLFLDSQRLSNYNAVPELAGREVV